MDPPFQAYRQYLRPVSASGISWCVIIYLAFGALFLVDLSVLYLYGFMEAVLGLNPRLKPVITNTWVARLFLMGRDWEVLYSWKRRWPLSRCLPGMSLLSSGRGSHAVSDGLQVSQHWTTPCSTPCWLLPLSAGFFIRDHHLGLWIGNVSGGAFVKA